MRRRIRTWCWWWQSLDGEQLLVKRFPLLWFMILRTIWFVLPPQEIMVQKGITNRAPWEMIQVFPLRLQFKARNALFYLAKKWLFKHLSEKMVSRHDYRTNTIRKSTKPIMSFVQCDLIILHQRVEARSWNPSATQSTRASLSSSRGTSYQTCLQVWWVITDDSIKWWWLRWHSWLWDLYNDKR